jgi:hypothetical protein
MAMGLLYGHGCRKKAQTLQNVGFIKNKQENSTGEST